MANITGVVTTSHIPSIGRAIAKNLKEDPYWKSFFDGYPGFSAFPYAEYSEAFFGSDYRVLRGGSWFTDPLVARPTFRNWDLPQRRQIFSGLRCARDV